MLRKTINILLVDDDEDDFILTRDILDEINSFKFTLEWEVNYQEAKRKIKEGTYDICLIDYRLGENDGISLISEAYKQGNTCPCILMTGKGDQNIDLRAMQEGAADYLVKDEITTLIMERSIRYALSHAKNLRLVKEGELKFRQLFERSIDAIYICDSENNLIDVNPALCQMLDYEIEEIVSTNMSRFFKHSEEFQSLYSMAKMKGEVRNFEATLVTKNGLELICQMNSIARNDLSGNIIGFQGIIRDITTLKKAEEELLIAEKLSLTGKIARSVAHEVRNPLTNVSLASSQIREELTEENEEVEHLLKIVDRNIKRIGGLITDLLNSSKPKELVMEEYGVNDLVEGALKLVRDRFTLKGMTLNLDLDPKVGSLLLDREQLTVALVNIMINALEAMKTNEGELKTTTEDRPSSVTITLKDNGTGISRENLKKLFDPFYTKKKNGMGLGLTATLNVIQNHGGTIEVHSELGKGTSFIITLPKVV